MKEDSPSATGDPTQRDVVERARALYPERRDSIAARQRLRPGICPFERLISCVPPGSSVLDVGCGGGLFLGLLATFGRISHGVGFDASGAAIERAREMSERIESGAPALRFERLDVEAPWPEGVFDVVSIVDVMHHVPPPAQESLIALALDRIRPGGLLLYKDIAGSPAIARWTNRLHDLLSARQWIHYAPSQCVEDWAVKRGARIVRHELHWRLWYRHELGVFQTPEGDAA